MSETAPVIETEKAGSSAEAEAFAKEHADLKDRHLRLQAEFENFRKRKLKESDEIRQFASVNVVETIIPVLDHLDIALDRSHDRTDPRWGEGIDLIAKQLLDALRIFGLEEIAVVRGEKFDHALHEAIAEEETGEVKPGHVSKPVRKGYRIRDRVIRHAHVLVAKAPAAAHPVANSAPSLTPEPPST